MQRLRRASLPPVPDELAWLSKLAARFDVQLSPHASMAFEELARTAFPGLEEPGELAPLLPRGPYEAPAPATTAPPAAAPVPEDEHLVGQLRLLRYRPLFSGPLVDRVPELHFQRPERELELAAQDAAKRGIATGDTVHARSNGTSVELRARVNRKLVAGVARVADEHAGELHQIVEVVRA